MDTRLEVADNTSQMARFFGPKVPIYLCRKEVMPKRGV